MILHALKKPLSVGAVASASSHLVSGMVSQVDSLHEVVVELGAGTGAITNALSKNKNRPRKVVSIEIDQQLAEIARDKLSGNGDVIVGNAIKLATFFDENQVDCIVCSLPLTLFSEEDLDRLLSGARAVLKDDGVFVFYLYRVGFWSHRYKKVTNKMENYFSRVRQNKTIWRNFPPARVIVCS
jgi:phosphatidylethanolamine/phosphatidyl-N-methylethanolamine N-methyltransferase